MNIINLEEDYKQQVLDIWEKYKNIAILNEESCEYRKSPILPQMVAMDAILFIGINPSFKLGESIPQDKQKIEFYPFNTTTDKEDITYFEKFKDISNYCNDTNWSHIDLLFIRETNQKVIERLSYTNVDFLEEQLNISFEIIERAKPKLIVVANSFASEFFGKKKSKHKNFENIWKSYSLDFEKDFDSKIGTYRIKLAGNETPIIFSGMLSGQRALDIGSLERLKWQIKMILGKNE